MDPSDPQERPIQRYRERRLLGSTGTFVFFAIWPVAAAFFTVGFAVDWGNSWAGLVCVAAALIAARVSLAYFGKVRTPQGRHWITVKGDGIAIEEPGGGTVEIPWDDVVLRKGTSLGSALFNPHRESLVFTNAAGDEMELSPYEFWGGQKLMRSLKARERSSADFSTQPVPPLAIAGSVALAIAMVLASLDRLPDVPRAPEDIAALCEGKREFADAPRYEPGGDPKSAVILLDGEVSFPSETAENYEREDGARLEIIACVTPIENVIEQCGPYEGGLTYSASSIHYLVTIWSTRTREKVETFHIDAQEYEGCPHVVKFINNSRVTQFDVLPDDEELRSRVSSYV